MFEFKLPDIGEGLAEAELLEWNVEPGDLVAEGDVMATVSTDKVNVELNAPRAGAIAELRGEIGDVIRVGTVIVVIDDGGRAGQAADVKTAPAEAEPRPARPQATARSAGKVRAAPAVRRYAAEQGADLSQIDGSGRGGLILREDIDAYLTKPEEASAKPPPAQADRRRERLTGGRLKAAQNLARSAHTMATSTISFDVRADRLTGALEFLAPVAEDRGVRLTPLALIAKCVGKALILHPRFNATIDDDANSLVLAADVDLGIAVATDDGLIVPVLRDVAGTDVYNLASAIAGLAERGRAGTLGVEDLQGSSFTLSSTGGLEKVTLTSTAPVINYPNAALLWVSRISDRPWAEDGELKAASVMSCSLAFDHRYLHGADAIAFINDLDGLFQEPARAL